MNIGLKEAVAEADKVGFKKENGHNSTRIAPQCNCQLPGRARLTSVGDSTEFPFSG